MSMHDHRQRRRTWLAGVIAAAAVAGAAGCGSHAAGSQQAGPDAPDVLVAAVPATGAAALYIAQDRGFFSEAGVHVRIVSSVSAASVLAGLVHGSVAVSLGQWTSALAAQAHGIRLRAVAAGNTGAQGLEELVSLPGSGITRPGQLAGKTIAVNALAGLSQLLAEAALAADGIRPASLHWVAVPFPDMAAVLSERRADAAFLIQPYLTADRLTELADIDTGTTAGFPITGYVSTAAWASAHPAALTAFTRAVAQGQRIAATDPAAVVQAVARHTGIRVKAGMPLGGFPPSVTAAQLTRVATLMRQYGLLPATADPAALAREILP
jgi:NitT/TauT family transport system substrate-binding protein